MNPTRLTALVACVLLLVTACAPVYTKAGITKAEEEADQTACYEKMTERWHWTNRGVWALETYYNCLEARGYQIVKPDLSAQAERSMQPDRTKR